MNCVDQRSGRDASSTSRNRCRRHRRCSRLSRSGSAANSSSSAACTVRLLLFGHCRAHIMAGRQMPPRLDLMRGRAETSERECARPRRRRRTPSRARKQESAGEPCALLPDARDPRLGAAELHRRAVQHPVGLDAADAVHRRLSASSPNGPTAIRATAFRSASRRSTAASSTHLPEARRRRRLPPSRRENADLIKRVIGLPGDTVEVRSGRLILNGRAVPRERACRRSTCRSAPTARASVVPAAPARRVTVRRRQLTASIPAYRETLPGGPSYTVLDQVDDGAGRRFPARQGARRATSS